MLKEGVILIKVLVLSRFDVKVGPKLFLNVPESKPQILLAHIPLLMDFYEKGFFIHEFGELKSSNLIFTIPSPGARGDIETLMISIVLKDEEDVDPRIFQGLLEQFVYDLKEIKDSFKGFYIEEEIKESHQIYTEIKDLLYKVYDSFPKETVFMKPRDINLTMFDFSKGDKSQIAKILGEFISTGQYYKHQSEESSLLYNKISISEYSISISKPLKINKFLILQLKNQDGLIFVIDIGDNILFRVAEITLDLIFKLPEFAFIPSLILVDKANTDHPKVHKFIKDLRIDEDENKIIKYITITASDDDEIRKAINWIIERITIIAAQVAI
ncbi:MAG: hypothetical protein ACFFC9_09175 [Promethearchaeota archaeon]